MVSMGLIAAALTVTTSSRERGGDSGRESTSVTVRGSPCRSTGTTTARVCEGTEPLWLPPLLPPLLPLQVAMARERCSAAIAVMALRLLARVNGAVAAAAAAAAAATAPAGRATQRSMIVW